MPYNHKLQLRRMAVGNPDSPMEEFELTIEMSSSGTLFDLDKLNDVSKEVLVRIPDEELYDFMLSWAKAYRPEPAPSLRRRKICFFAFSP